MDLRGEESPATTLDLLRDDGTTVPVYGRGALIPYGGRPAVQVVLRDVTEEQRAEAALRETRDYLDNLINYANAPIIVWDPDLQDHPVQCRLRAPVGIRCERGDRQGTFHAVPRGEP